MPTSGLQASTPTSTFPLHYSNPNIALQANPIAQEDASRLAEPAAHTVSHPDHCFYLKETHIYVGEGAISSL